MFLCTVSVVLKGLTCLFFWAVSWLTIGRRRVCYCSWHTVGMTLCRVRGVFVRRCASLYLTGNYVARCWCAFVSVRNEARWLAYFAVYVKHSSQNQTWCVGIGGGSFFRSIGSSDYVLLFITVYYHVLLCNTMCYYLLRYSYVLLCISTVCMSMYYYAPL